MSYYFYIVFWFHKIQNLPEKPSEDGFTIYFKLTFLNYL